MRNWKLWPLLAAAVALSGAPARAASHAEAPLIAEDPKADNTDVYFFRSPADASKVVILANYIPFEEPSAGPTYNYFSSQVLYEIHVDRNQDGVDDLTFQFRFKTGVQNGGTFLPYLGPITQLTTDGSTVFNGHNLNPNYNKFQFYTVSVRDVQHGTRRSWPGAPSIARREGRAEPPSRPWSASRSRTSRHFSPLQPRRNSGKRSRAPPATRRSSTIS
jgi:hypothetical protein